MRKGILISMLILFFGSDVLKAQESINSSGYEAKGTEGTVSFSVGQVMYVVVSGMNANIEQGIQQPFVSSVLSGFENSGIQVKSTAYPNPTSNELKLEVENLKSFEYQLVDVKGNIIQNQHVDKTSVVINMTDLPGAIYLLKVISSGSVVKTFKIIKN